MPQRRAPQGARGLKFISSLPACGSGRCRRAPQGARGLKYIELLTYMRDSLERRAPQGARGLKYFSPLCLSLISSVAPRKGRVG